MQFPISVPLQMGMHMGWASLSLACIALLYGLGFLGAWAVTYCNFLVRLLIGPCPYPNLLKGPSWPIILDNVYIL